MRTFPHLAVQSGQHFSGTYYSFSAVTKLESEAFLGLHLSYRNLHQTSLSTKKHVLTRVTRKPGWASAGLDQLDPSVQTATVASLYILFPLLISSHFLPIPSTWLCLLCSPFSHRIAIRSSKLIWTFELMSSERETKMHSQQSQTNPLEILSLTWLGPHACLFNQWP